MSEIAAHIADVKRRMEAAALACGRRPAEVGLVAVSKTVPAERVRQAIEAGVATLGENYIQEARDKIAALADLPVSWHFIGRLQSNKAKFAVPLFDLIHSVDSLKLAREIDKQAAKHGKRQRVLIQVNTGREETKSGVFEEEARRLVREVAGMENLALEGLMTLPPFFDQPERVRPFFRALRELRDRLRAEAGLDLPLASLSMGMTGDFEAAIAEGATLVRIGTAIFGERR
jgi:pyridoxal phosphate enzyme (YggS family)